MGGGRCTIFSWRTAPPAQRKQGVQHGGVGAPSAKSAFPASTPPPTPPPPPPPTCLFGLSLSWCYPLPPPQTIHRTLPGMIFHASESQLCSSGVGGLSRRLLNLGFSGLGSVGLLGFRVFRVKGCNLLWRRLSWGLVGFEGV